MFLARVSALCLLLPLASFGIPSPRHYAERSPTRHHQKGPEHDRNLPIAPSECQCGVANLGDRMVGDVTKPLTCPWQVALVEPLKTIPYCGGALISDLWVLTTCTCTLRTLLDHQVLLGLLDWTIVNAVGLVRRHIAEIVKYPGYGLLSLDKDIALLKLSSPVPLNQENIAPVGLPALGQKIDEGIGLVTGWGLVEDGGVLSEQLLAIEVAIQPKGICLNLNLPLLTKNMICVGLPDGGNGVCQAESGSPLVMDNGHGIYELIGIASGGLTGALPGIPGLFVNVASYADWISDIVGSKTCPAH